jgi:hypothetical protein
MVKATITQSSRREPRLLCAIGTVANRIIADLALTTTGERSNALSKATSAKLNAITMSRSRLVISAALKVIEHTIDLAAQRL